MLKLSALSKSYGSKPVIRSLNLELRDRGIFAISGPNGIGKSTLFRLLAGAEVQSSGSIQLGELNPVDQPIVYRQAVSWTPEMDGVFPFLTPEDYFRFLISVRSLDASLYPHALIEDLALSPFTRTKFESLSLGNKKKTLLIGALMVPHRLLLLDESFAGFDAKSQIVLRSLLVKAGQDALVLLVNHDMAQLEDLAFQELKLLQDEMETRLVLSSVTG
jgi:ABC-2 type transport system ATP-binding protein